MDKKFFGGWHVIAGRNFGINVTHEEGSFLRAAKNPLQFVIYRCANWFLSFCCLNVKLHFDPEKCHNLNTETHNLLQIIYKVEDSSKK